MSGNVLAILSQLRDTQEKLRVSEARCESLEEENRKLRLSKGSGGGSDIIMPAQVNDALMKELQQQLIELTKRNTDLERQLVERNSALRHQYEMHIDNLELELRRAKVNQGFTTNEMQNAVRPLPDSQVFHSPTPRTSQLSMGSGGRTSESRRNLL